MSKMKLGQNMVIFILFFGIALVEAIKSENWLLAVLFTLLGIMFLRADNTKKK